MKRTCYTLLTGVLVLSVAEGGDVMMDRAQALMAKLNVEFADTRELPKRAKETLPIQELTSIGDFAVRQKVVDVNDESISSRKLDFLDANGRNEAVGIVQYTMSARVAQETLFKRLSMNSLPLEVLLNRYEIKKDGPGDICVVEKIFNKELSLFVIDDSRIHFVRGNVVLSIQSKDSEIRAIQLARAVDQILVEDGLEMPMQTGQNSSMDERGTPK